MTAQQKYIELISCMKILSCRAINENNKQIYEKLNRLAKYLEEVKSNINKVLNNSIEIENISNN